MESAPFYVLGFSPGAWVLALDGYQTEADARRAIRWQGQPAARWEICTRVGRTTFRTLAGERITVKTRQPYTERAWSEFLDSYRRRRVA